MDELNSRKVFVAGSNTLQNELIASTLQQKTGFECVAVEELAQKFSMDVPEKNRACLALYDCIDKHKKDCLSDLKQKSVPPDFLVGLFNVERSEGLEKEALSCGARGFFYRGEPFSLFVKGVTGIFKGEFWISRKVLSELVPMGNSLSGRIQERLLSEREKEILRFVAGGATKQEIADALFLSRHTVKNHLQKIFRKIDVHSETKAAFWAARYLR
jgi:LuxR family transcriptional regulator, positive regulator of biofilm formation